MTQQCKVPPAGWYCTRAAGHDGPCAALPSADTVSPAQALDLEPIKAWWRLRRTEPYYAVHAVAQLIAEVERLRSPSRVTPEHELGWLVELGSNPPRWWTGRPKNGYDFTPDASRAMRFARREDAEGAIGHLIKDGTAEGCKAIEHMWVAASRVTPTPEGEQP